MKINILAILLLLIITSCNTETTNAIINEPKPETPEALQESNDILEVSKYSFRNNNLVNNLYKELVNENDALKKLENDLQLYLPKIRELNELCEKYDEKSKNYHQLANQNIEAISDSSLKHKMVELIKNSSQKYSHTYSEYDNLSKQITKNNISIDDYHTVLKLVLTLPLIEKYQVDSKPNKNGYLQLINQQQKLLETIDSLTKTK